MLADSTRRSLGNCFGFVCQVKKHFCKFLLRERVVFRFCSETVKSRSRQVCSTIKGSNGVGKQLENFVHAHKRSPQKQKIVGKVDLIRQKGFSFEYLSHLIEWSQVKYPRQQNPHSAMVRHYE